MAISLKLREEEGQLVVTFDDQTVKTALDKLPAIDRLQADPFTNGQVLTAALGDDEMLKRLADDPHNLILLDCDDKADAFAWEFATLPDRQFLCVKAGMLRTVPRNAPPVTSNGALNFIALAADPLVDEGGNPLEGYRLDLDNEMRSIRETLQNSGKNLTARRIPPTREHLNRALRQGPAVLHLTCHGNVVDTPAGKLAVLALENKDGSIDPLTGADLLNMSPRGVLRMVLLSSCMTATGSQANLARALTLNGVPFAIGMQESFPDPLSDDLAVALYDSLFSGLSIGEALRQARMSLARHPQSVGLPVGYVSANGWSEAFPIQQGMPSVGGLGKLGESALGGEIQPPRPLLGRNLELHQIAKHFASGASGGKVLTVAGTGGMGKTALAAAFAERFAWMWTRGVSGYSFANEVNAANFRYALMRALFGNEGAQQGASLSESQQREAILKAAREWNGLWLFDNYESIIRGNQEKQPEAENIHRLIADLANGDADILLTSREQPVGLKNERLFPDGNHALHGLGDGAGMELFFQHSVKAKEDAQAHADFALAVQRAADGHPLAIALLAGEYDVSAVPMQAFLSNWQDELASARRGGLAGHHVTFTIAFERSYSHLSADLQQALCALSIFPFPFFAWGMAVVTGELPTDDDRPQTADYDSSSVVHRLSSARQTLNELTRRSLLEVDATYTDDTPATYRFQPALRQEAARRQDVTLIDAVQRQESGYAAYGTWLAKRGYSDINSNIALNHVVRLSMDAMEKATNFLQGVVRLWHIHRLAWLKNAWGETPTAFDLLNSAVSQNLPDPQTNPENAKVESSLRYELAGIYITRGDLDHALQLYQDCLQLDEQLGDKQGKASSLHAMAQVFLTRGDLDRALALYEESLQISEQIGDKRGKASSLHAMAQVFLTRGDLDRALALYEESLRIKQQLGDEKGKSATLHQIAQVFLARGDLDRALALYQESLQLSDQLGDEKGKSASLSNMAQVYLVRNDLTKALELYQQALIIEDRLGDMQGKSTTLSAFANLYIIRNDLDTAINLYRQALEIAERIGDLRSKANILYNMASVFMTQNNSDMAMNLFQNAFEVRGNLGDIPGKIMALQGLAIAQAKKNNIDKAATLYVQIIETRRQWGITRDDPELFRQAISAIFKSGLFYLEKLNYQSAVTQFKANLLLALEIGEIAEVMPSSMAISLSMELLGEKESLAEEVKIAKEEEESCAKRLMTFAEQLETIADRRSRNTFGLGETSPEEKNALLLLYKYSIMAFDQARDLFRHTSLENKAFAGLGSSRCAIKSGAWYKGVSELKSTVLPTFRRLQSTQGKAQSFYLIGAAHHLMGDYELAEMDYKDAIRQYKKNNDEIGIARAKMRLGHLAIQMRDPQKAKDLLLEALIVLRKTKDSALYDAESLLDIVDSMLNQETSKSKYTGGNND